MLKKIKLGSSLAALILFVFPWLDIQCSEKSMATQSGIQIIYGGSSPSEEMKASKSDAKPKSASDSDESLKGAPLVALGLLAVIGAVVFSLIALFQGGKWVETLSSILPAVALVLLLVQLMIGFPVNKEIEESMSEGSSMTTAVMANIRVKTTPVFYFELLALGIPSLLLANGLIDRYKKSDQGAAQAS